MIVYHGSNVEIYEIQLEKCNKYKDFGQGFYVTTLEDQAKRMAQRTVARFGGIPTVTSFEFDETELNDIKCKKFIVVDTEWAIFVVNNRDRSFKDISNVLSNHDNKYDVVSGAVANDDIATTFALYKDNFIDSEELSKRLKYKNLNDQYSFHTPKAISLLKKIEVKKYE